MLPLERSFFNRRCQREIPANSESGHNSVHDQKLKKTNGTLLLDQLSLIYKLPWIIGVESEYFPGCAHSGLVH